ncbi:divalent-cation tolerance protein CutA [Niveispirillum cyanobacteriorum]|uniref:divalent-cation tolerance protein CutA n=1 Tax=Niveispirillum cyanobacteriorum TaxID=1612173 RepID=UPI001984C4A2|nr:divalent cation tolerance protein CutA [Niveispirillum cyanobacteriorum]GGE75252.1 divalent-cation tolerance protein CutA [Niveispirillum cyanobacteriorum]
MTASDREIACVIGRDVVVGTLAACADILQGMESFYCWQGKAELAAETVLILTCGATGFAVLAERVKALHSYRVPCIIALSGISAFRPDVRF